MATRVLYRKSTGQVVAIAYDGIGDRESARVASHLAGWTDDTVRGIAINPTLTPSRRGAGQRLYDPLTNTVRDATAAELTAFAADLASRRHR